MRKSIGKSLNSRRSRKSSRKEELVISPEGEEFEVDAETTNRFLNEKISLVLSEIREEKLALKEGDLFLYTNLSGDIPPQNKVGFGLYFKDTRFLSTYTLKIADHEPILLHSTADRYYIGHIEATNLEFTSNTRRVTQHSLNLRRLRVIQKGLYERLRIKNYNSFQVDFKLELLVGSDFADIFEVRGLKRRKQGQHLKPRVLGQGMVLAYLGLDNLFRRINIRWSLKPISIIFVNGLVKLVFDVSIAPQGRVLLDFFFDPAIGELRHKFRHFNAVAASLRQSYRTWEDESAKIETDNKIFNVVIERARNDLRQLLTHTRYGEIIYGGVPWFAAPFGRDALIAARQTLCLRTSLAKGTLNFCSKFQGKEFDANRDEEPGKIFHEIRQGEMANLGEVPQTPYYGSIDSTLLFLNLAADYFRWTGEKRFLKELEESVQKAWRWVNEYADLDGDGFIEYLRHSAKGLTNQGWKDSWDGVSHRSGKPAQPPIALVEVQAYLYAAKVKWAEIYRCFGQEELAGKLEREAQSLRERFEDAFWWPEENYYYLALDADKRPVEVVTSNPGHALWSGLVPEERAEKVVRRMLRPDLFSGWGIRTVSKASPIYNPMSYHNGSVWPHDTSLALSGMKRCGFDRESNVVATALYEMVVRQRDYRFPELLCGFTRRGNNYPVDYPVACIPQAWGAGSVFLLLESILGLEPYAHQGVLKLRPFLPHWLNWVKISNLRVGKARISLIALRAGEKSHFELLEQEGVLDILEERGRE
jgi:glycogen debranching enzyme